ncbi:translation initiation factor IF-2, mitochondrial [Prorops nasuta]|uniref:translation initiation factor IF-2, mitochondrial n=1 Tax=Prorops nasuta TaxID=863751 RepID=UPI0034CF99D0
MARLIFKTCSLKSTSKLILNITKPSQATKLFNVFCISCVSCQSYHSTPIYYKRKVTEEEKVKVAFNTVISPKKKLPLVTVWPDITVSELASVMQRDIDDICEALFFATKGEKYTPNSPISQTDILLKTVKILGSKCFITKRQNNESQVSKKELKFLDAVKRAPPDPSTLIKRHPVVTIMGHVDHGKTTLLDTLRHTSVVKSEFGGITQHIGAFNVTLDTGEVVTFLDTPGHAAFSTMRARGAQVTDIVVLVVAADDGVMEQTIQSIQMAKDAKVPIVVAVNKIDKSEADVERTHTMLAQNGVVVEQLGGDVQSVSISALKGTNINGLIDTIVAQAEIMELKGDPTGLVEAVVIESTADQTRGKLATILIQRGTLKKGTVLVSGLVWCKVRAIFDHKGTPVSKATLSDAVQVIGWKDLPIAGDEILEVKNEQAANAVLKYRKSKEDEKIGLEHHKVSKEKYKEFYSVYREELLKKRLAGNKYRALRISPENEIDTTPRVNILIKADVLGSVEAILDVVETYDEEKNCRLDVVHYGVGPLSESEVDIAKAFNAIIYCFNTIAPKKLQDEAKKQGIPIRFMNVIYKLVDSVKEEINKKLPKTTVDEIIGQAEVLQEFEIDIRRKKVKVAGCRCVKGMLVKSESFRVVRNGEVIHTGKLASMRHLKTEVNTVKVDVQCGLRVEDPTVSFMPGDIIVCFKTNEVTQETKWNPGF